MFGVMEAKLHIKVGVQSMGNSNSGKCWIKKINLGSCTCMDFGTYLVFSRSQVSCQNVG